MVHPPKFSHLGNHLINKNRLCYFNTYATYEKLKEA
jgi:hypothetical protein